MAREPVFDFKSYKSYLASIAGPKGRRSGIKQAMAQAIRCQPTYMSQVLHGRAELSLEQAEMLSEFLGHSSDEKHYFLLLLQHERAGTSPLKKYFNDQIEQIIAHRLTLTRRYGGENKLSQDDQAVYYSSWQYAAIHIALTVPELRSPDAIGAFYGIRQKRVSVILDFLCRTGMAQKNGASYEPGTTLIRLGNSSHNILKHHANWRAQAIESLEREEIHDLHYSGVISLSQKDSVVIKDRILQLIEENLKTVRSSKEEQVFGICMDFFSLKRE